MTHGNGDRAVLRTLLRYEFHGILHLELRYARVGDAGDSVQSLRVPAHQVYENPQPGDEIEISYLMGLPHHVACVRRGGEGAR